MIDSKQSLIVKIYQIGGTNPEGYLGTACDPETGKSLIELARMSGGSGVSLHGISPGRFGDLSGEYTFDQAIEEFKRAEYFPCK